jgi:hypothetical protein
MQMSCESERQLGFQVKVTLLITFETLPAKIAAHLFLSRRGMFQNDFPAKDIKQFPLSTRNQSSGVIKTISR